MAVVQYDISQGRDFTAEELMGRDVRIENPSGKPYGHCISVFANDERVNNVQKFELIASPNSFVEVKLTLWRDDQAAEIEVPTEEVIIRENLNISLSGIVSEVH